jgi:PAS domain S-box-containing protein
VKQSVSYNSQEGEIKHLMILSRKRMSEMQRLMRKKRLLLLPFFLFFVIPAQALNPSKSITQYVHQMWQTENGLPHDSVAAIVQTRDGYIWVGTGGGLAFFDGVHFTVFDKRNTPEIKNDEITALFEDSQGSLWIGTGGGGLVQLKDKKFRTFTTKDGLVHDYVNSLYGGGDGCLWIGTESGLSSLKNGKFSSYTIKDGLSSDNVRTVFVDRENVLWVATYGGGLNRLQDGKFTAYTDRDGLSNNYLLSICEDRKGNIWVGTLNGLNLFKNGKFTVYTTREGLSHNAVRAVYEDSEGVLWAGTYGGGLNRFKDGRFTSFTTKEGLSNDSVRVIYEDRDNSLWIGTYGGGLDRLKEGKFTTYTTKEGLSQNYVMSVCEGREGSMWVGTAGGGLNCLKEGKFTIYTKKHGLSLDMVMSIIEDRQQNLWIGTGGGGLSCLREGKFTTYTTKDGLSHDFVRALYEGSDGSLWIGTHGGGLNRLKDGRFTSYTTSEGMSNDLVMAICEDKEGNLWVGTGGGLSCLREGKFTTYTTKDGLSHDFVRAIYKGKDGNLWIGTHGGGLNRLKDGRFTSYSMREGLYDDAIYQILEDERGYIWMGCSKGVFCVSKTELEDFAEGRIQSITSIAYDKTDGMRGSECASGTQPGAWRSRDGRLWFSTLNGLAMIDPKRIMVNTKPPDVIIERVVIDNKRVPTDKKIRLGPGKRNFEFHYTGLNFISPEKVRFKYKLDAYDKEWVDVSTRRTAYYTSIPPGNHKFQVIACNNDGFWNEKGASFNFYLKPFFYQTLWFYLLCSLGIVSTGVRIFRIRVRQLRKHKAELEEQVKKRTIELRAANEELQEEILERKKVEEEIRELKDLNEGIIQSMTEGIIVENENEIVTFINPATERFLGYSSKELLGCHWKTFIPADQFLIIEEANNFRRQGKASRYEVELQRKDGSRIQVLISGSPTFENGNFSGTVAVFTDITELKQVKEEIEKRQRYLESVLHDAPDAIVTVDASHRITEWNPGAERVFGYKRSEVIGKNIDDIVTKPDVLEGARVLTQKTLSGEKVLPHEVVRYRRDKTPVNVIVAGSPIKIGNDLHGVVAVYTDITERKKAEKKIEEFLKELERSNTELEEFAYIVSHDLKAPLRAINQLAGWISEDYSHTLDDEGREHIKLLITRVKRMDNLIDGILQYSRVGRIREKKEKIDLNKAVQEIIENIAPPDSIRVTARKKLPVILAERVRIQQVFQNLIGNAVKYMDKPKGEIEVSCADDGDFWRFSVSDNGPGIDEKYYEKIFQIFQTLESRDKRESTGVGLSVVKKIVELYGGRVWVESEVSKGSTFFFTLPKKNIESEHVSLIEKG